MEPKIINGIEFTVREDGLLETDSYICEQIQDEPDHLALVSLKESAYVVPDNESSRFYRPKINVELPECITVLKTDCIPESVKKNLDKFTAKGVVKVEDRVFEKSLRLKSCELGKVEYLGDRAFAICGALEVIPNPYHAKFWGESCFCYCVKINGHYNNSGEVTEGIFIPKTITKLNRTFDCSDIEYPYDYFVSRDEETKLVFEDRDTDIVISDWCFDGQKRISEIINLFDNNCPNVKYTIGRCAFKDNSIDEKLTVNHNVILGPGCLMNNKTLDKITFDCEEIPLHCTCGCRYLEDITLTKNVKKFYRESFKTAYERRREIILNGLDETTFIKLCKKENHEERYPPLPILIDNVEFYEGNDGMLYRNGMFFSRKQDGTLALIRCSHQYAEVFMDYLDTIVLPKCVTSLEQNCLNGLRLYTDMEHFDAPGVTIVGDSVFEDMPYLIDCKLGNLTYVGNRAFAGAGNLKVLPYMANVEHFGSYSFEKCNSITGGYDKNGTICNKVFFPPDKLETKNTVNIDGYTFQVRKDGTLKYGDMILKRLSKDSNDLALVGYYSPANIKSKGVKEISIPSCVKVVREHCFDNAPFCKNEITKVTAPGVEVVEDYVFCDFTKMEICTLGNLRMIGDECFYGCESLLYAPDFHNLEYLGYSAYSDCLSLRGSLDKNGNKLPYMVIPDNVKTLDNTFSISRDKCAKEERFTNVIFEKRDNNIDMDSSFSNNFITNVEGLFDNDCPNVTYHIGPHCFQNSGEIEDITIKDNVILEEKALSYMNVKKLHIDCTNVPASLLIRSYAGNITFGPHVKNIHKDALKLLRSGSNVNNIPYQDFIAKLHSMSKEETR